MQLLHAINSFCSLFLDIFIAFVDFGGNEGFQILVLVLVLYLISSILKTKERTSLFFLSKANLLYFCGCIVLYLPHFQALFLLGFYLSFVHFVLISAAKYRNLEKGALKASFFDNLKNIYYHPKYINLKSFWAEDFLNRKKTKTKYIVWEILALFLLSFFCAINTRFSFLQLAFIARCIFFGMWDLLAFYIMLLVFCTFLSVYPPFYKHINDVYNTDFFVKTGWNTNGLFLWNTGVNVGKVVAGALTGVMLDDLISPSLNFWHYKKQVEAHHYAVKAFDQDCIATGNFDQTNPPKFPHYSEELINKRFRHSLPSAVTSTEIAKILSDMVNKK